MYPSQSFHQFLYSSFNQSVNGSAALSVQQSEHPGSSRTRHSSNTQTTNFAKELINFNTKIKNSDRKTTRIAKLWANSLCRILSNKKIRDRSIERANSVVMEVEQGDALEEEVKNTIQMLEEYSTDAEQARTKAMMSLRN